MMLPGGPGEAGVVEAYSAVEGTAAVGSTDGLGAPVGGLVVGAGGVGVAVGEEEAVREGEAAGEEEAVGEGEADSDAARVATGVADGIADGVAVGAGDGDVPHAAAATAATTARDSSRRRGATRAAIVMPADGTSELAADPLVPTHRRDAAHS